MRSLERFVSHFLSLSRAHSRSLHLYFWRFFLSSSLIRFDLVVCILIYNKYGTPNARREKKNGFQLFIHSATNQIACSFCCNVSIWCHKKTKITKIWSINSKSKALLLNGNYLRWIVNQFDRSMKKFRRNKFEIWNLFIVSSRSVAVWQFDIGSFKSIEIILLIFVFLSNVEFVIHFINHLNRLFHECLSTLLSVVRGRLVFSFQLI